MMKRLLLKQKRNSNAYSNNAHCLQIFLSTLWMLQQSHDMLACVGGELAQLMADAARMMGMDEDRIQVFSDYQQVLDRMGGALEKHDVVLVKGSRFVELDRFVEGVC